MAKQYETNPLEEDVWRRAEQNFKNLPTNDGAEKPTQFFEAATRNFYDASTMPQPDAEPTNNLNAPYNSVFVAPTNGKNYAPISSAVQTMVAPPTSRKVLGLGLPENVAMILPYLPFHIGAIAAVIALLFASRAETRVRFHAAQGLALHLAAWIISAVLSVGAEITDVFAIADSFFWIAMMVFFIICCVRVYQGKPNHIEALDDVTDFLNEKLKLKNNQ